MSDADLVDKLRDLARNSKRPDTARLRDIFDEVERAKTAGVSRQQIHHELVSQGFTFSLRAFDNAMARIRKSKQQDKTPISTGAKLVGSQATSDQSGVKDSPLVDLAPEDEPLIDPKIEARKRREAHAARVVPAFGHNPLAHMLLNPKKK